MAAFPTERRQAERRDVTRPDSQGRRLIDRIRDLDPTILECGPECMTHGRRTEIVEDNVLTSQLVSVLA